MDPYRVSADGGAEPSRTIEASWEKGGGTGPSWCDDLSFLDNGASSAKTWTYITGRRERGGGQCLKTTDIGPAARRHVHSHSHKPIPLAAAGSHAQSKARP